MCSNQAAPAVKDLLDQLKTLSIYGPASDSVLEVIADTGQFAVVPELVPLLDADNPHLTRGLLRTIGILVARMPPDRWAFFEEAIKTSWTDQRYCAHYGRKRYDRIVKECHDSPSLLATINQLAIFHFDGFVREAAIAALDGLHDGSELACLLCRLNDWVSPVREAARQAVLRRMKPEYANAFARCLPLLVRISEGRRTDHSAIIEGAMPLLVRAEVRNTMMGWLRSGERAVRRAALTALCTAVDPASLEQAARGSSDPVLLRDWLKAAVRMSSAESVRTVAASLIRHPIASLRRASLEVLMAVGSDAEVSAALQQALLDRSAMVRSAARDHLTAKGWRQFDRQYRAVLDAGDSARAAAALGGLGETGTREDVDQVGRFLKSPMPAVRRAALRALAMLAGDAAMDVLAEHLCDASSSVSRTAARLLRPYASAFGADRLWLIYLEATWQHTRRNLLQLIPLASKWDAIAYLLLARCDADDAESVLIEQLITQWVDHFNRDLTAPTPIQRQRAAVALQRCIDSTPSRRRDVLRFLIQ